MSKEGELGVESVARAKLAGQLYQKRNLDLIVTSGWAYRDDSDIEIGLVFASYLQDNFAVEAKHIIADTHARDTVGDAFFIRRALRNYHIDNLTIVSSDYHAQRTKLIFDRFFAQLVDVEVIGVQTYRDDLLDVQRHEASSSRAFMDTFEGVDIACDTSVMEALNTNHPFYNGAIYSKLSPLDI
jgi:uncharacterized SAM-binding protein YcdF (DUF218 family)